MKEIKNKKINKKYFVILGVCLVLVVVGIVLVYGKINNNKAEGQVKEEVIDEEIIVEEKKVQIVDMDSNKRPYAVMINNHYDARPQVGLDKAYIVYELMVEGGITRMMALYEYDSVVDRIGSIRSSRHYFLDYAMENDAVYVHWGYSTYAKNDINKLDIDNVNGMIYGNKYFYTDNGLNRDLEHTRFTNSNMIKQGITDLGYRTDRKVEYLLNYTTDVVDLSMIEGSMVANDVSVKYSNSLTANYKYNSSNGYYYRSINNESHVDLVSGMQYCFKNIIVYSVDYSTISKKGHQDIKNVGSGEGYYITNGYASKIKWSKASRDAQTIYTYMDGTEIDVSDGNTFIQIYPTNGNVSIS